MVKAVDDDQGDEQAGSEDCTGYGHAGPVLEGAGSGLTVEDFPEEMTMAAFPKPEGPDHPSGLWEAERRGEDDELFGDGHGFGGMGCPNSSKVKEGSTLKMTSVLG